ncbi:MAG: metallophosphoesterase [Methylocystis sp.]|jgi:predicted MPP superfamily phosphohydrolase
MITRRALMTRGGALLLAGAGLAGYSVAIEPNFIIDVTKYAVRPVGWPPGLRLRIAVISDLHACEPWMPVSRIRQIAAVANALAPDLVALLGDFSGGTILASAVMPEQWGEALSSLRAPLGVHAILGNHDWWHGALPQTPGDGAEGVRRALRAMGANLMENDAVRLEKNGEPFWLLGLGDQMSIQEGPGRWRGHDDLPGTLNKISDHAPAILLAHEPFVFSHVPKRIALTLSGHTHGGQINLPFAGPIFAELRFKSKHIYGHIEEDDRHLIISGGLGESIIPARFMRPPEIVLATVEAPTLTGEASDEILRYN